MSLRSLSPGGISIDVALPRWPFTLARAGIGLVLLAAVAAAIAALVWRGDSDSSSSLSWDTREVVRDDEGLHLSVVITTDDTREERHGEGWSVLLDDGRVVPGTASTASAEPDVETDSALWIVSFALSPQDSPVHVRWFTPAMFGRWSVQLAPAP